MFPIRDHNPSRGTPLATYALIAANVAAFLLQWPHFADARSLAMFWDTWAMVPAEVTAGRDLHGVVTSMFLHAGLMHLGGNMLFLWIFGDNLEEEMGHLGFLAFYLASGLLAAAAHLLADPWSPIPTVGASGAIAGVMGGYLLMFPRARVDVLFVFVIFFRVFALPAWLMLGVWFGLQVLSGVGMDAAQGGVAYWAHAGGFVAGVALTLPVWLRRGGPGFWRRTDGHPPHPEAVYRPSGIPVVRRRRR